MTDDTDATPTAPTTDDRPTDRDRAGEDPAADDGDRPAAEGDPSDDGAPAPRPVVEGLAAHATCLSTTDPAGPLPEFDPLRDRLAEARVVGLGEASHGTREFFRAKHRLLRYLVTECGVRAFALEANRPEARALDAYVRDGEGDPESALADVYFWTWQVESVREFVEWLRSYNADRPREERVRFHGVDVQYTTGAVRSLRSFFEAVDPAVLEEYGEALAAADDDGTPAHADDERPARVAAIEDLLDLLRARLEEYDPADPGTPDALDRAALARARDDLRVLERAAAYREAHERRHSGAGRPDGDGAGTDGEGRDGAGDGDGEDPALVERTLRVRDEAMAETVARIADRTEGGVAVWAHDAHVARTDQRSRRTEAVAPSMGSVLADRYGDRYLAVGFSAERMGFQAIGPVGVGDGGGTGSGDEPGSGGGPDDRGDDAADGDGADGRAGDEDGDGADGTDGPTDGRAGDEDGDGADGTDGPTDGRADEDGDEDDEDREAGDDGPDHALKGWTLDGPLPGTTEATVAAAVDGPAVLDLRAASNDDRTRSWLARRRPSFSVGAVYDPRTPEAYLADRVHGEAFDLLVHVPETERARPLDGADP